MSSYILAIDQGTTSTRAFLIDATMRVVAVAQQEFQQFFPKPGWVEHDAEEIWASVLQTIGAVLKKSGVDPKKIAGIGVTNQRETTVVWDRATHTPIHRAIVWQCRRTAAACEQLRNAGFAAAIHAKTGLVLDAYFSATKIAWILDHVPNARLQAENGILAAGTIDSFLAWRLTNGRAHVTDVSNASRTMLMDLVRCAWDETLCEQFRVPMKILPRIVDSSAVVGATKNVPGLPDGIPIAGLIGDQQAALCGQACFSIGQAKCTYGTGSFIMMHTGERPIFSTRGLLTTVAWRRENRTVYALEGASFIAGAAVQWLRDGLGIITSSSEIEALAARAASTDGVMFVPALAGLGAPHWRPEARGIITGLTRGSTAAHLARATLEGIALQQCDLLQTMHEESGVTMRELRVDGGACANNLLMQMQADFLDAPIIRPQQIETTVLGAAFMAGLAVGVWSSEKEISAHWQEEHRFAPAMSVADREAKLAAWRAAVAKA